MPWLFSAFAAADLTNLRRGSLAAFGVFIRIPTAVPTGLFLIRSRTIFTFLGVMRRPLKYALASIICFYLLCDYFAVFEVLEPE